MDYIHNYDTCTIMTLLQESVNSLTKEILEPLKKDKAQDVASGVEASEKPSEPVEAEEQNDMVSETSLNCCPVNYI